MVQNDEKKIPYIIDFYEDDEEAKDLYVRELENAIQKYIKTGKKSKHLDDAWNLQNIFQKKYQEIFDIDDFVNKKLKGKIETELVNMEKKENIVQYYFESDKEMGKYDALVEVIEKPLKKELDKLVKDIAYLSHVNLIFELYKKEEQLRKEEKEFEKISRENYKISDITKQLNQVHRMEFKQLYMSMNISEDELKDIIENYQSFFNIRPKQKTYQVSLSPRGRKYSAFVENMNNKYSQELLNGLVYKNCNAIIDAVSKSYDARSGRIEVQLKLDAISRPEERALQHKYHQITKKFVLEDEMYILPGKLIRNEKERIEDEKNCYTIPGTWNDRIG